MHVRELTRRKYRTGEDVVITGPNDVLKVLGKMKGLPSPGSWPAKVSFGL